MFTKLSIICASENDLTALASPDLANLGVVLSAHAGSAKSLARVLAADQPDVVLMDFVGADDKAMEQIEMALRSAPGTHMVLVSPDRSVEFLMRAMRAGVREVLPAPMSTLTVQLVAKHAHSRQPAKIQAPHPAGRVLAMIPAKGGPGATFLATNLAYALSKQGKRVALLDLNLYFGDAAMFLSDSRPVSSVADLSRQTQRLDAALLQSSMIKVNDHLHVLAAPESPDDVDAVTTAGLEKIIDIARRNYDFVILDVSSTLDPVAVKALDLADAIYLTLQLTITFVRAANRMATVFKVLGYPRDKLRIIVNRFEKGGEISLADAEKSMTLKVERVIPNSYAAVRASVNQGIPLIDMAPRDPVTRALQEWAEDLAPSAAQPKVGWLQGLLKSA
jgi:pilus assembly protein CpaE